MGASCWIAET